MDQFHRVRADSGRGSLAAYAVAERLCNARTYAITPTRAMELLFAGVLISLFSPIAMRIVNGAIYSYQFDVALLFYFGPLIPLGVWLVGVIIVGRVMVASKPELEGAKLAISTDTTLKRSADRDMACTSRLDITNAAAEFFACKCSGANPQFRTWV